MGGRIVGALILGRIISSVTKRPVRYLVQELHSTKGWKPRTEVRAEKFPWALPVGVFCWTNGCGPHRREIVDAVNLTSEKALLRHGWYRRKLRKEAERARHSPAV